MSNDYWRAVKEWRQLVEKERAKFQGMIKALRMMELNRSEKSLLTLFESTTEALYSMGNRIAELQEHQIELTRAVVKLDDEIKKIKETLNTFTENK